MEKVLQYLELKNQFYKKFFKITSKFMERPNQDSWDDLEYLVDCRERILNIIRSFDHKIEALVRNSNTNEKDRVHYGDKVRALLENRNDIASRIVKMDLELISKMEELKSETIRELKESMEHQRKVESFADLPGRTHRIRRDS